MNGVAVFEQEANNYYANTIAFSPLLGGVNAATGQILDDDNGHVYGGVVNDRGYRLRCAQYDEMRIVSMKVKLMPQTNASATTQINPAAILSVCDRSAGTGELQMDEASMTDIDTDVPSPREIEESAGVILTQWNNNRIAPVVRSVYARDLSEKEYCDCSIDYGNTESVSPLQTLAMAYVPNFSPAIYYTIKSTFTAASKRTYAFVYSVEYNVIFRNPKSDLQTFVVKENPTYVNPDSSKYTRVKSDDPYVPDKYLNSDGKELVSSWYARYKARCALRNAKKVSVEVVDESKAMEVEDDPGTA